MILYEIIVNLDGIFGSLGYDFKFFEEDEWI